MKGKRTGIEFEKHELIIHADGNDTIVHQLKKPDTICQSIKFINTFGVLMVLGDYGHWMFNRSFVPGPKEYVSDSYWLEKCEMEGREYDRDATEKELTAGIKGGLAEYGFSGEYLKAAIAFYKEARTKIDEEWVYTGYIYGYERPGCVDHEMIPYCKMTKQWLRIIFDGFDEICRRLKETEIHKI